MFDLQCSMCDVFMSDWPVVSCIEPRGPPIHHREPRGSIEWQIRLGPCASLLCADVAIHATGVRHPRKLATRVFITPYCCRRGLPSDVGGGATGAESSKNNLDLVGVIAAPTRSKPPTPKRANLSPPPPPEVWMTAPSFFPLVKDRPVLYPNSVRLSNGNSCWGVGCLAKPWCWPVSINEREKTLPLSVVTLDCGVRG